MTRIKNPILIHVIRGIFPFVEKDDKKFTMASGSAVLCGYFAGTEHAESEANTH